MPGARPSPRFVVTSYLVLFLVLAGVLVKLAGQYLPAPKPNRLYVEYSPYVRAAALHALDWYPFSTEVFEVARSQEKPLLLEIGTSFSRRSQSLSHYAFHDTEFLRILSQQFVCVRVDFHEMPWVAQALALNSPFFSLHEGSIIAVLDPSGRVYSLTPFRPLYAVQTGAGLMDWTTRQARAWVYSRDEVLSTARNEADARRKLAEQTFSPFVLPRETSFAFARDLYSAFQTSPGTFYTAPGIAGTMPFNPGIPALLLETGYDSTRWLEALCLSPCYDWVDGGFFISAVEPGWRRPQFAKASGHSALLALECARAGTPLLTFVARQTFKWILKEMVDPVTDMVMCGLETDEGVRENSTFYEWKPGELPVEVKRFFTLSGGYGSLMSLVLGDTSWLREGGEDNFMKALRELQALRAARPSPAKDRSFYADAQGQVLSSLYGASVYLQDARLVESADRIYRAVEVAFVQPSGSVIHALRGRARVTGYFGDYVWMARSAIEKYKVTGDDGALRTALRVTDRMRELFSAPGGGFWNHLPGELAFADFMISFRSVVDDPIESSTALAIRNLRDLALITQNENLWKEARRALEASGGLVMRMGIFSTGYFRSLWLAHQPAVLAHRVEREKIIELQRSLPRWTVLPTSWSEAKEPGFYWVEDFKPRGPYTEAEIRERAKKWMAK